MTLRRLIDVTFPVSSAWLAAAGGFLPGCAAPPAAANRRAHPVEAALPAFYAQHSTGIVAHPTARDSAQAVAFGTDFRDNPDRVKDTYLTPPETTPIAPEAVHFIVRTPLYLVARHAMERARAGRPPDPAFLEFARTFDFVRIAVSERYVGLDTWQAYALDHKITLLRNGNPVPIARTIPGWKGADPFLDPADPWASWQSDSWLKHGLEDMERQSLLQKEERRQGRSDLIALEPGAAVYRIEELRKPGRYEIVLSPTTAGGVEARVPIDFSRFP